MIQCHPGRKDDYDNEQNGAESICSKVPEKVQRGACVRSEMTWKIQAQALQDVKLSGSLVMVFTTGRN